MSSKRAFSSNPRFLFFLYMILFSTVTLWITYMYGMDCNNPARPPLPMNKNTYQEIINLRNRLKRYELFEEEGDLPFIYAITPTFTRPVQKAELVRLSLAFLHVRNFHWIVVEDSVKETELVAKFLNESGLKYTHLNVKTQEGYRLQKTDPNWKLPRGVDQRNAGIDWLIDNHINPPGVVYFADDDNTYSLQLFKEMRHTRKVSVWPVGLVGGLRFERPLVSNGRVTGWYTMWERNRPFAMDMAGFAINLKLFQSHPDARFNIQSRRGYVESSLLTALGVTLSDLEAKAENCSKIYVWHTRTEKPKWTQEDKLIKVGRPSDPKIEV